MGLLFIHFIVLISMHCLEAAPSFFYSIQSNGYLHLNLSTINKYTNIYYGGEEKASCKLIEEHSKQ